MTTRPRLVCVARKKNLKLIFLKCDGTMDRNTKFLMVHILPIHV